MSPESDMNPKECVVQYSAHNEHGPWEDGFEFLVPRKSSKYWAPCEYDKYAKQFRVLLLRYYRCLEDAFEKMDRNGSGRLSYAEFYKIATGLTRKGDYEWSQNVKRLFQELDTQKRGAIGLDDFLSLKPRRPTSRYWRLVIKTNWDSILGTQLLKPLVIHVFKNSEEKLVTDGIRSLSHAQERQLEDKIGAFALTYSSPEDIAIRDIAKKHCFVSLSWT